MRIRGFENFDQCGVGRYQALPTAHSQHQEVTELLSMASVVLPHSKAEPQP